MKFQPERRLISLAWVASLWKGAGVQMTARREEMSQRREYNRTFFHLKDRYGGLMMDEQLIKCIFMLR